MGARLAAAREPESLDTINWIHISDFQFESSPGKGRSPDYGRDEVQQALLEDLAMFSGTSAAMRGAEHVAPDFILVTGDLAFSGKPDQYERAETLLREVVQRDRRAAAARVSDSGESRRGP